MVVVSPYSGDGKTTLVEALVGRPLEWRTEDVTDNYQWHHADISCGDIDITISECFTLDENKRYLWPDVSKRMRKADLILYVHDSTVETTNSTGLEECIRENDDFEAIVYKKRIKAFTKYDQQPDFNDCSWFIDSKQQEGEGTQELSEGGRKLLRQDRRVLNLCGFVVQLPMNEYDVSCKTKEGIAELRDRIKSFLFG